MRTLFRDKLSCLLLPEFCFRDITIVRLNYRWHNGGDLGLKNNFIYYPNDSLVPALSMELSSLAGYCRQHRLELLCRL